MTHQIQPGENRISKHTTRRLEKSRHFRHFWKIESFKVETSDKRFHKIKIPTPRQLETIFTNWFVTICKIDIFDNKTPLVNWKQVFFINSDVSEIGVEMNILSQKKGQPQTTRILLSKH